MRLSIFVAFAMFLLISCGGPVDRQSLLPGAVGASGDIVVVMDKPHWESLPGEAVREAFGRSYDLLPQAEGVLSIQFITHSDFDRFWKPHRNVLFCDLEDRIDTQEPSTTMIREKYAKGQIYAHVKAKNYSGFLETFKENAENIIATVEQAELKRIAQLNYQYKNEGLMNKIKQDRGFSIVVPRDAELKVNRDDFVWIDRQMTRMKGGRNHDVQQGFFIYSTPYTADSMFSASYLLSRRDSVLKANVPGTQPDSYMATEYRYYPTYEEIGYNGAFAAEIKGLWRMEGEFMGGPFFSMTLLHPKTKNLVTVEGYAYAPYFDKREYIREVEAIIKTIDFEPEMATEKAETSKKK